ncbi:MAG: FAD-binding protein [Pseudomonadota bacterium]
MRPLSEDELAGMIRDATGPLRIRGGGTRPVGRPAAGAVLETAGLSGIPLYEPGALTLVVRAGTALAEVEARLAAEGQRLPFEPPDWRGLLGTTGVPTIGAVVAGNLSGPRRVQAGACRDSLIGVRFVDGSGNVVKNGGRVMKNVTGYDLVKLMAGSWGTLGVLTEVAFKVLPAAGAAATLSVAVEGPAQAVAAMAAALGSPFDVTGAAWEPEKGVLVRIEGLGGSVDYRTGRLAATLGQFGTVAVERDPERVAAVWRGLRDVAPFHGRAGDVWRLSVKPSEAPGLLDRIGGEAFLDWGGGLIWALVPEGTDLRARIAPFAGHATLIRGSEATRARIAPFQPEPPALAALSRALRARFDPRGILNPGLMD